MNMVMQHDFEHQYVYKQRQRQLIEMEMEKIANHHLKNAKHNVYLTKAQALSDKHRDAGMQAVQDMAPGTWADENRALAFDYVYTAELLAGILREQNRLLSVEVSQEYRSRGRSVANVRIVSAGFRLAHLLNGL